MATYDLTQVTPNKLKTGDIINVPYSGTYKTITLPKGVYKLEVWGAQGGSFNTTYVGGKGGYSYGTLTLKDKETVLYCYAGGKGTNGTTSGTFAGGWNGGGKAYTGSTTYDMSAGGGGSDIRIASTSLYARVIVAGGGGGAGSYNGSYRYNGGAGGGTSGVAGGQYSTSYKAGLGGTQTAAGTSYYSTTANSSNGTVAAFGTGGAGKSTGYIAGGGGGWYGGGFANRASAGGGSGYVYTASTASNYPSGCLLNSAYYLTDAATIAGNASFVDSSGSTVTGHSGNGYVRITVIKAGSQFKVKTGDSLTVLPYIESTGTQYINTNINTNQNTRIVMDATILSVANSDGSYFFGSMTAHNSTGIEAFTWDTIFYGCYNKVQYSSGTVLNVGDRITIDFDKNNCTVKRNQIEIVNISIPQADNISTIPLHLFELARENYKGVFRLHSCKIYDDNTLVRDFIPVLDSQVVACLFDKVEQKLYYNQGTGVFYYVKPAELPEGYIQVEYIQSSGTQYIDVGFKPNQDTRVMMDVYTPTQSSYPTALFGGRNGDTSRSDSYTVWLISATQFQTDFDTEAVKPNIVPVGRFFVDKNKITTTINGETHTNTSATFQSNYNLALLTQIDVGGADVRMTAGNLYSAKVYDNDILIRDFVPCINPSGEAGLYDIIENKFYRNSGTGKFITSADIVTQVKLPEGYNRIEYIESAGTQYIDTGFKPNQNTRVVMDAHMVDVKTSTFFFGVRTASYTLNYNVLYSTSGTSSRYGGSTTNSTAVDLTKRVMIDKNKNVCTINGVVLNSEANTFQCANTLFLFASSEGGTAGYYGYIRLYSCQIYDNDTLIRNYIPCVDSNGVVGLYDTVNNTFCTNDGDGTFNIPVGITGHVNLPNGYTQLSYIESNGTQYIDTLFGSTAGWKAKLGWMFTLTPSSAEQDIIAACYISGSTYYREYLIANNSKFALGHYTNSSYAGTVTSYVKYDIDVSTVSGNGYLKVNGDELFNYTTTYNSHPAYNVYLFAMHESSGATSKASGRLYYLELYNEADELVRNYVPCKNTSGIVGLYDLVENKFYTNAGTGNFIAGSVVEDAIENKVINFETWVDGQDLKVKASVPYTKLSYIEATGTQYIDTEHQWQSNNVKVEIQYAYTAIGTNSLFGSETSTPQYGICAYHPNTTDLAFWVGSSQQLLSQTVTTNLKYNLITHANNGTFTMSLNNVTSSATYSGSVQNGRSLFIFCNNIQSGISQYSKIKLYSCKMYDNNVLVRDYIPVLDKNGIACLYDKVTDKLFYNNGTGNFAYKRFDYTPVEYIQSTGTQWIDTNWYPSSAEIGELKFVIDATFGTAGSDGWAVSGIGSSGYFFHTGLNSNRQIVYGSGTADVSTGVTYTDKRVVAELDYKAKTMKWTEVDSGKVLVNQSITVNTPTASVGKFYLFAYATAASAVAVPYTGVIYSFKGYKNNVLIHDIIPVIDSDGTVCMFDKVTQHFLYNSGTGNFTAKYYPNEELEYLSSDGNSYIDTGFTPNQNTRIDIVTMPLSVDDASANTGFIPYGSATAYNNNAFECYSQSSQYEFNFCTSYSFVGTAKIGELITISHDKNNVTVISDGKSETLTLTNGTFTAPYTLTLFGTHRSSVLCGKQRIYSCQIYDNENLVRDYVPKTDANGTPCMYDKITDKYYYNQGTGAFNGIAKNGYIELSVQHASWTTVKQLYKKVIEDLVVLDYIESTGTQYIDTGFKPSSNTSIDIDIEMTNSGKANAFYGSRTATKSNSFILFAKSDGTGFNFYYGTTSTVVNSPTGTIIGRFSIQQNANVVTINGVSSTLPAENFTGTQNMFLFAANTAGAFDTQTDINRIRMCKIYDNGTLVRDYIPVLDASGVACLYDKVTNQLFYNQGTGEFVAGYKTEFEPETELAFLASTGTQYIDTGFKPNHNTRIVMKAQLTSSTTEAGAFLFGARTSSNSDDTFSFLWYTSKNAFRSDYANDQPTLDTSIGIFDLLYLDHNKNIVRLNNTYCEHTYTSFSSPVNLTLFCVNTNGTKSMYTSMRLYSMEIYDNENLVRDYIPKTDSQGVPALYDKVSNTYYYNQGTGNFGAVSKTNKIQHVYWKQVI